MPFVRLLDEGASVAAQPIAAQKQRKDVQHAGEHGIQVGAGYRAIWRFYCFFLEIRSLRAQSRARMPVLVQVSLDLAYFQTHYTRQPSCSLQAPLALQDQVSSVSLPLVDSADHALAVQLGEARHLRPPST